MAPCFPSVPETLQADPRSVPETGSELVPTWDCYARATPGGLRGSDSFVLGAATTALFHGLFIDRNQNKTLKGSVLLSQMIVFYKTSNDPGVFFM